MAHGIGIDAGDNVNDNKLSQVCDVAEVKKENPGSQIHHGGGGLNDFLPTKGGKLGVYPLSSAINRHDHLYHAEGTPEISDAEYDRLAQKIRELEVQFPELASHNPKTVGAPSTSRFAKFEHPRKMLSLGNLFTNEDVERFARPIFEAGDSVIIEPKFDGLSVALHYTLGGLGAAVTRGDGSVGDLVTENVKRVQGVPHQLHGDNIPTNVEVRGEVYMSYPDFEAVNAERAAAGEKLFANPRNAAVGALKSSDPEEVARRRLSFVAYDLQDWEKHRIEHIGAQYDRLLMHGFKAPLWAHADSSHELLDQISVARERRKTWSFPTDGVVIKATRHTTRITLGTGTTGPNWAAAFKYPPTQVKTRLLDIDVQIGRTGVLTPVARLEPVQLDGTVVSNATLHNFDEVARKDIRVGDIVVIEKAGEIIPIVVAVDMDARSELHYQDRYVPPTHCPHCNSPTVKDKSALRCGNSTCKGRVLQQLVYFVSKAAMDIQHVGEALLESLVGHKLNSPADLYTLTAADITAYYQDGSKIAARALASIEASKSQPAWRVLAGLGIPGVGSNTSKQLLKVYGSINELATASPIHEWQALTRRFVMGLNPTLIVHRDDTRSLLLIGLQRFQKNMA